MLLTGIAVLLRILTNPLANVFQKQLTNRDHHPLFINFLTFFILSVVCIPLAIHVGWFSFSYDFWLYCLLMGLMGSIGNGFLIKALQSGDLSVLGPVNSYKSVVGIIVGFFLLGEVPGWWGVLGIVLIIWGSYFVLDTTKERFSFRLLKRKDIQYRIWAMLLTAIEAVFIKKIILLSSTTVSFIVWCWFGAAFSFLLLFVNHVKLKDGLKRLKKKVIPLYLYLVLCIGVMQYTTNYVFNHMEVGYGLALFQLSTIVSIFLGYHVFKEQDIVKKLIGSVIMVAGSIIIILLK
ncbi:MAG: DMT family transporter [Bacteroidales bacterium]|jgi:drug/metabolite transporter (DMT)-like permease|nr:DMT family transporter [Bacteroidales bacterium]